MRALVTLAERLTVARLRPTRKSLAESTTSNGSPPPSPSNARDRERSKSQLAYDPSSVFLLELMVSIASRATQCLPAVWCVVLFCLYGECVGDGIHRPIVFDFLAKLLSSASSYSSLLTERAVVGLLRLAEVVAGDVCLPALPHLAVEDGYGAQDELNEQLFVALDALRKLPPNVLASVAEQLAAGLLRVVSQRARVIRCVELVCVRSS